MPKAAWKPGTLLSPVPPVMVSCGTMERPNIITIGWTGIVNTAPAMTYISVRPQRYSYSLIEETGEFVINLTTKELVRAADYCGVKSGADVDKWSEMQLTPQRAVHLSAPLIAQSPLSLECRVTQKIPLGTHHLFLAEILGVDVEEEYIDRAGKLHLERCGLVAYAHGAYYEIGKQLGTFGYSVKKQKKPRRRTLNKGDGERNAGKARKRKP